jgi:site-specific recombinase XerD
VLAVLSSEQVNRLYHAAQSTATPARDAAILSLLLDTGCRASELCGLTLDAVTFTADAAWLLVHDKGRKEREVALGRKARQDLHRYLYRARRAPATERHIFLGKQGPLTPGG